MIDALFGVGSACFAAALLPAVWRRQPPPLFTCVLTAFWLWVFTGCYVSLHYAFSAATGGFTALLWTTLAGIAWNQKEGSR